MTGWHRKHAIRALRAGNDKQRPQIRRGRRRRYGPVIEDALAALWEASDHLCGKRLKVMIPVLLPGLERHGRLQLSIEDRAAVLNASAATIDRLLAARKLAASGGKRRRAGQSSAVRREVPVRTFNDWGGVVPGYCEIDLVAHGGTTVEGVFIQTLTLVDVVTGWTQCLPIVMREGTLVVDAIARARTQFPWQLRGLDFDNDSAFMNDVVVPWCRGQQLEVTRSRAYKKNDQAFVEQKNGALVRRLVGYGRFEGIETARTMARLYAAACLLGNFFQPSFKLKSKRREGAKVIKRYFAPETPCSRALAHPSIDDATKERLCNLIATLDPIALLAEVRAAQHDLGHRVDRRAGSVAADRLLATPPTADFVASLGKDSNRGEQRAIHRRPYIRRQPLPRRTSMMDAYAARIDGWLTLEPHLSAAKILARLRDLAPSTFTDHQSRTVQRIVRTWRGTAARRLLDSASTALAPTLLPTPAMMSVVPSQLVALGNIAR